MSHRACKTAGRADFPQAVQHTDKTIGIGMLVLLAVGMARAPYAFIEWQVCM